MRIDVGVAVPGKMLQRREQAARLQPAHVGGGQPSHERGIFAVRARVDHRVARIVVDVHDGREVHLDADRARFDPGDASRFERELLVAGRAERHVARKLCGAAQPESGARLEIRGVEERQRRDRLEPVERRRRFERIAERDGAVGRIEQHGRRRFRAAENVEAAEMVLVDLPRERVELRGIRRHEVGAERRAQHLADLLVERHLLHRRAHPGLCLILRAD